MVQRSAGAHPVPCANATDGIQAYRRVAGANTCHRVLRVDEATMGGECQHRGYPSANEVRGLQEHTVLATLLLERYSRYAPS